MIKLKLKKGLSYAGIVSATKEKPYVTVEDEATANAAVASGYFEVVELGATETPKKQQTGAVTKLDVMNVTQLKEYAKTNGIDLTGVSRKEDILARINEVEAAKTGGGQQSGANGDDDPSGQFTGSPDDDKALEDMSDDELKAIAEKNAIDISGLETREDILAAINAAEPAASTGGNEGDGGSK